MMKDSDGVLGTSHMSFRAFTAVKYLVYALLSLDVWLFVQKELGTRERAFVDGV